MEFTPLLAWLVGLLQEEAPQRMIPIIVVTDKTTPDGKKQEPRHRLQVVHRCVTGGEAM